MRRVGLAAGAAHGGVRWRPRNLADSLYAAYGSTQSHAVFPFAETMGTTAPTPRRDFIGQLALSAAAMAADACRPAADAAPGTAPTPAPAPPPAQTFDDAWTRRTTGKHKAVFDAPEVSDGTIVANACVYLDGFRNVYETADADMSLIGT